MPNKQKRLGRRSSCETPSKKRILDDEAEEQTMTKTSYKDKPNESTSKKRILPKVKHFNVIQPAMDGSDSTATEHMPAELCEQNKSNEPQEKYPTQVVPQIIYCDEFEVSKLITLREEMVQDFLKSATPLTYRSFFIKAISRALLKFPELNGWVNPKTCSFEKNKSHNVGTEVDTQKGAVVAYIKEVQNLNIVDIAKELYRLQKFGVESTIPSVHLTGGTITLSHFAKFAGTYTTPAIITPQIVIGAIGRIRKLPLLNSDGTFREGNKITVSWVADNRFVEFETLAKFATLWKEYIRKPTSLIYE